MFYHIEDKKLSRTILKTRRKILEISYGLFCREGVFKTTMVDIARDVDVTRRTLYNHFDTKEEIALLLHRLLLNDILDNCKYKLIPGEITKEGIRNCLTTLFSYLAGDKEKLAFIIHFDQYSREHYDLIGEDDLFVNYLLNQTQIVEYFKELRDGGQFKDPSIDPALMARVCFESLIAYMERITFREEAHKEQGFPMAGGFDILTDRLLSGISGGTD